jgi:hypothetical protein
LTAIKIKIAIFSLLYVFVGKLFFALVENHFGPEEEWSLYRDALRLFQLIIYY